MNYNYNSSKKAIYKSLIKTTLLFLACVSSSSLSSQLNLKIAYNFNYSQFESHNSLLADYNDRNTWLAEEFGKLNILSGIQLGARLRNEFIGVDFSYERSAAEKTASGVNFGATNIFNQLNYKLNRFSLGLEAYKKAFGIGANISYEQFNISQPIVGLESQRRIVSEERFANRIYLIFSAPGSDRLSISLQPYISVPWSHFNISPLKSFLGTRSDTYNIQENLHFGFSLVFYNGPQI